MLILYNIYIIYIIIYIIVLLFFQYRTPSLVIPKDCRSFRQSPPLHLAYPVAARWWCLSWVAESQSHWVGPLSKSGNSWHPSFWATAQPAQPGQPWFMASSAKLKYYSHATEKAQTIQHNRATHEQLQHKVHLLVACLRELCSRSSAP